METTIMNRVSRALHFHDLFGATVVEAAAAALVQYNDGISEKRGPDA